MRWLCLIGDPVEKSLSPEMHNAALAHLGLDRELIFVKRQVPAASIHGFMRTLKVGDFAGLAVTMPHKSAVIPHLDYISPEAEQAGAVNTIVCVNGTLQGHNTDGRGCVDALLAKGVAVREKNVTIIGAGGAARAAAFALAAEGAARIDVVNRTPEMARELAAAVSGAHGTEARWGGPDETMSAARGAEILINATPAAEAGLPLRMGMAVLDMAYGTSETELMRAARAVGAVAVPGTEMLLRQGALQFELFTGRPAPVGVMRMALERRSGP
jgi:shikimate dehydrogenase